MNLIDQFGYAPGDVLTRKMGPFTRRGVYLGQNRVYVHDFASGKGITTIAGFAQGRMPTVEKLLDLPEAELNRRADEAMRSKLRHNPFEGVETLAAPAPDARTLCLRATALAGLLLVPVAYAAYRRSR